MFTLQGLAQKNSGKHLQDSNFNLGAKSVERLHVAMNMETCFFPLLFQKKLLTGAISTL